MATIAVKPSLASIITDPNRNFKFNVVATGGPFTTAINYGFMTVDGISTTIDVIPYREGGMNTTTQNMPGQASFNPVTFSTGVKYGTSPGMQNTGSTDVDWMKHLFDVMQGGYIAGTDFRAKTVDIQVLDHPVTAGDSAVKCQIRLYNAWPTALAYSTLDAGANQVFIEQMTLVYEGFDISVATGDGAAAAPDFPSTT
jgi:phage tail-like protein